MRSDDATATPPIPLARQTRTRSGSGRRWLGRGSSSLLLLRTRRLPRTGSSSALSSGDVSVPRHIPSRTPPTVPSRQALCFIRPGRPIPRLLLAIGRRNHYLPWPSRPRLGTRRTRPMAKTTRTLAPTLWSLAMLSTTHPYPRACGSSLPPL